MEPRVERLDLPGYIPRIKQNFIITNFNIDIPFSMKYYNGLIWYKNRKLTIDTLMSPCLYLYRKGEAFFLTNDPYSLACFCDVTLAENDIDVDKSFQNHITNRFKLYPGNAQLFNEAKQIYKWKEISIPDFTIKENDDMFTEPFSEQKADEWYNKWKGILTTPAIRFAFDISGGQDTRILASMWRDRKAPFFVYGKDIKNYTKEINDGFILHSLYDYCKNEYSTFVQELGPVKSEYDYQIKGNGTEFCRMKSMLNSEDFMNVLFNQLLNGVGFNPRTLTPFIDDLLLSMHYDFKDQLHDYLFRNYCPDLCSFPFWTFEGQQPYVKQI